MKVELFAALEVVVLDGLGGLLHLGFERAEAVGDGEIEVARLLPALGVSEHVAIDGLRFMYVVFAGEWAVGLQTDGKAVFLQE